MADEHIYRFEDYRREPDPEPERVPCARCGKLIDMHARRCEFCGVHFGGEAFEFSHPSEEPEGGSSAGWFYVVGAVLLGLAMLGLLAAG